MMKSFSEVVFSLYFFSILLAANNYISLEQNCVFIGDPLSFAINCKKEILHASYNEIAINNQNIITINKNFIIGKLEKYDEKSELKITFIDGNVLTFNFNQYFPVANVFISKSINFGVCLFSGTIKSFLIKCEKDITSMTICTNQTNTEFILGRASLSRANKSQKELKGKFLSDFLHITNDEKNKTLVLSHSDGTESKLLLTSF